MFPEHIYTMDPDCANIWDYILRMGVPKAQVRTMEVMFIAKKPITKAQIAELRGISTSTVNKEMDALLKRGWVIPKNAVNRKGGISWQYGLIDINSIINELDEAIELDYIYQKALVRKSREWLVDHAGEVRFTLPPDKRRGRPPGSKNRKKKTNPYRNL